jgi:hypothetical protein
MYFGSRTRDWVVLALVHSLMETLVHGGSRGACSVRPVQPGPLSACASVFPSSYPSPMRSGGGARVGGGGAAVLPVSRLSPVVRWRLELGVEAVGGSGMIRDRGGRGGSTGGGRPDGGWGGGGRDGGAALELIRRPVRGRRRRHPFTN